MPLDRTWYNTLVDDDGSGLTGSVWDKADVNALMNTIDAELPPRRQIWHPEWRTAEGGVCPGAPQTCSWHKVGDAIYYTIYSPGIYVVNATQFLTFQLPPGLPAIAPYYDETMMRIVPQGTWVYVRPTTDVTRAEVRIAGDPPFAVGGSTNIQGQGFYWWR
jgi:hypothetical protein